MVRLPLEMGSSGASLWGGLPFCMLSSGALVSLTCEESRLRLC